MSLPPLRLLLLLMKFFDLVTLSVAWSLDWKRCALHDDVVRGRTAGGADEGK